MLCRSTIPERAPKPVFRFGYWVAINLSVMLTRTDEPNAAPTRLLLYSPQPILAAGLQTTLQEAGSLVCSSVPSVPLLIESLKVERPCVVLLDVNPELGFAELHRVASMSGGIPLVLWVDAISTEFASQVIGLGVRGILRKNLPAEVQVRCLESVAAGELWIEKSLADQLLCGKRVALAPRERQLVGLLAQGLKNKEIANSLGITEGTVKVYLSRLFQKLGVNDRFDLALFALKNFYSGQLLGPQTGAASASRATAKAETPSWVPSFVSTAHLHLAPR
jgi:two-component system nitrate/nitrite response regulator NarP